MIKLIISSIMLFFLSSCQLEDPKKITDIVENKKKSIKNLIKKKPSDKIIILLLKPV